jgi:hypothetical protein
MTGGGWATNAGIGPAYLNKEKYMFDAKRTLRKSKGNFRTPSERGYYRLALFVFTAVLAVRAMTAPLWSQSDVATLAGTVSDPSGALIPGITVTVTNEATNLGTTGVTNDRGRYFIPNLKPGVYRVSVSQPGFQTYTRAGVTLQVNQTAQLNIALTVGEISEVITITAEAPILETETSSRGAVIDERKMIELPLNGRDYNQLATLSPGVLLPTPRLQSIGFKGAFNVNGNRAFHNAFQLDGLDNTSYSNSFRGGNVQLVQPSVEALQEFKVQTNAYSAEFGRSAGALINAVIKSGGNAVHGSAYEFHRNDNLDAANFFSNKAGRTSRSACAISSAEQSAARSSETACSFSETTKVCATGQGRCGSPPFPSRRGARADSPFPCQTPTIPPTPARISASRPLRIAMMETEIAGLSQRI